MTSNKPDHMAEMLQAAASDIRDRRNNRTMPSGISLGTGVPPRAETRLEDRNPALSVGMSVPGWLVRSAVAARQFGCAAGTGVCAKLTDGQGALVEGKGFEPSTSALRTRRSPS